jgi:truncated hemoglobin YjbI
MILAYTAMLGFKNNWIVIHLTDGYRWTQDHKAKPVKMHNGLFVIPEHVVQWLDQFKTANEHLLKDMKINNEIYGKIDLTGVHE